MGEHHDKQFPAGGSAYRAQPDSDADNQMPMLHSFVKRDTGIQHYWSSELMFAAEPDSHPQHVDLLWPLWHYLDLSPEGRGDFLPKLEY